MPGIGSLSQFTKVTESRFRDLEQSSQMLADLGQQFEALQTRLTPLKDERAGIKAVIHQLIDLEAQLGASIGTLERDGDISLTERIKRITESAGVVPARLESRRGAVQAGQQPPRYQLSVRQAEP